MKTCQGTVVKIIDKKTIKVKIVRIWSHPVYKKRVTRSKYYLVHVLGKQPEVGQKVNFIETKPISKLKKWVLEDK